MNKNKALAKIGATMLQNPDARHFGYPLRRGSGVRSAAMYRTLTRMLNNGWISDGWEDPRTLAEGRKPRRYYVLTADGQEGLAAVVIQKQTEPRSWWNELRPRQREAAWSGMFCLAGLALFAAGLLLAALFWPGAQGNGVDSGVAALVGTVVGVVAAIGGILLARRFEDRHQRKYGTTPVVNLARGADRNEARHD
uniref:PadR family transcriptional regulator n=1 Tax=Amycolatopsis sp. CA-096443 TaxID=3239919 RepID=UPI003F49123A